MVISLDLPENLEAWNFDTVVNLVTKYEFEPGIFDYKAVLNATRPEHRNDHNASIRRTACSMANADGGFILFGVLDQNSKANSPEERIVGMPLIGDLRKTFADKLLPVQRPIYFDASPKPIVLPSKPTLGIFVVYIPQSPLRPHMDESTGNFYRRGEGGIAEIMKFYEVREQMMFTEERLRKVTLFRLEIAQYRELIASLLQLGDNITQALLRFDTGAFKIILADICDFIPTSSTLLSELLGIPILANLVNEFLNLSTYPGLRLQAAGQPNPNIARKDAILGNLAALDQRCQQCEQEFEKLFGRLGEI
jgi:hypothetical protein